MNAIGILQDAFERVTGSVHAAVEGLNADDLVWRPDPEANTIGWLIWHLTRIEDDHLADITQRAQVWTTGDWPASFGLPEGTMDHGYGHTSEQVAAVQPESADVLLAYHNAVASAIVDDLATLDAAALDRVIDERWDPPVTVAVRLVSVVNDAMQHTGQAAYVRGLLERRG
ncbi:MAG TPA: DUF664 domain-containing protein [Euzebyales bacterium]|nr:DUF664 domain-containing protein [Euzebyales bacterium]